MLQLSADFTFCPPNETLLAAYEIGRMYRRRGRNGVPPRTFPGGANFDQLAGAIIKAAHEVVFGNLTRGQFISQYSCSDDFRKIASPCWSRAADDMMGAALFYLDNLPLNPLCFPPLILEEVDILVHNYEL